MTKRLLAILALAASIGLSHAQTLAPRVSVGQQLYSLGVADAPEKSAGRTDAAVGGVVRGGVLLRSITPLYPPNAVDTGVTGIVTVEATIGRNGRVIATNIVDGPYALRKSAQNAVQRFLYEPTLLNGKPVERAARVEMRYSLR
jgi:periplasmic protein TonB